jgi:hypothetical protein
VAKKGKPGPKAEVFKVNLPFEEAVKAALKTKPPPKERKKQSKKK